MEVKSLSEAPVSWTETGKPGRDLFNIEDSAKHLSELAARAAEAGREFIRARDLWLEIKTQLDTAWATMAQARQDHELG